MDLVFSVAFYLVGVLVAAGLLLRQPSDRHVEAFAGVYAVPLTPSTVKALRFHIWWSRVWRFVGAALALPVALVAADSDGGGPILIALAIGWAIGALIAELTVPRPEPSHRVKASLEPRRAASYVRPWLLVLTAAVGMIAMTQLVILLLRDQPSGWFVYAPDATNPSLQPLPSQATVWLALAAAIVVSVAAWLGARRVAMAPTPAVEPEREAVRHAVRTSSILAIDGAALMTLGVLGLWASTAAALADGGDVRSWQWWNNVATLVCALATFTGFMLSFRAVPRRGRAITMDPSTADRV